MKTDSSLREILPLLLLALALPAYQNCSPGLKALDAVQSDLKSSDWDDTKVDCGTTGGVACVFAKSPVNSAGRTVSAADLSKLQTYPGRITGLDSSGFLQSSDFRILTSRTDRLSVSQGFQFPYGANRSYLEQLMAYYSISKAQSWLNSRGVYVRPVDRLKVYVDSSFTGWIPSKNEIHFQKDSKRLPAALDGSLIVATYLQSQIHVASKGLSHENLEQKTSACSDANSYSAPLSCCSSQTGCGPALVSGAADFATALVFESRGTQIGESWKNDPQGQSLCGLVRNPAKQAGLTAAAAYGRCASRNASGLVPVMGLLYSSMWWEMRAKASKQDLFEKFFLRHLSLIEGGDDFQSVKTKLLSLDRDEFSGAFAALINSEFSRRGL